MYVVVSIGRFEIMVLSGCREYVTEPVDVVLVVTVVCFM